MSNLSPFDREERGHAYQVLYQTAEDIKAEFYFRSPLLCRLGEVRWLSSPLLMASFPFRSGALGRFRQWLCIQELLSSEYFEDLREGGRR